MDVYGVRERAEDAARLAIVHVPSHSRQRHNVVTLITFASVSIIFPLQNGHAVGRVTVSLTGDSDIVLFPSSSARGNRCHSFAVA